MLPPATQGGPYDLSKSPTDIYDPKTLAVMDQAFAAIWNVLRANDPFRDYANDSELRIAIGHKLMNLVADGVTDPSSAPTAHRAELASAASLTQALRCSSRRSAMRQAALNASIRVSQ